MDEDKKREFDEMLEADPEEVQFTAPKVSSKNVGGLMAMFSMPKAGT